jgi:hypothetical protein
VTTPIGKARGEGNCSGATQGGKEACGCVGKLTGFFVVSRIFTSVARLRTETCYKAGAARRVGTTPRSRSQTASQVKHELARRQITFLSGEICPAPGSRACPKAWNPAVQAVVGEAEVSRGRSTDPAHPMRTGRTERRRTRRSHRTARRERSPSSPTPSRAGEETTGSLSRPGRTAAALCEKPRLGLLARIPEDSGTR